MAENTKIEWAHHTFNPWIGCTKVSPACMHCYAERDFDRRLGQVQWGPNGTRVLTSNDNWAKPLKWNRDAQEEFEAAQAQWVSDCCWFGTKSYPEPKLKQFRKRVFCASLADVFEDWQGPIVNSKGERLWLETASSTWIFASKEDSERSELARQRGVRAGTMADVRQRLFSLIDATPNLNWLLLTKRPENIRKMWLAQHLDGGTTGRIRELMDEGESKDVHPYFRRNVWLGTSIENQGYVDQRIQEFLQCRDLSPVLFLSCEPLLGPIDLSYPDSLYPDGPEYCCSGFECGCRGLPIDPPAYLNKAFGGVDWVIAGGESGPQARPTDPEWFRSLRDQCQAAGVPFLFKQWGEFGPVAAATPAQLCKATFASYKRGERLYRIGKAQAGRVLDGVTHNGFPNE
jgi:protein gp37